jgi:hypothetical protein
MSYKVAYGESPVQRILIVGDSHTNAIKAGLRICLNGDSNGIQVQVLGYAREKQGKITGDMSIKEINALASNLNSSDLLVSAIGGNMHQVVSLVQHPIAFDFFMQDESLYSDTRFKQIIPYSQILDFFNSNLRSKDCERLLQLKQSAKCKVCHLIPPPPKENHEHILKKPESAFINNGIMEKGISNPYLRLKAWKLQVQALEGICKEMGVDLLKPPSVSVEKGGFLKEEFYANDATHANAKYGHLVLNQLADILKDNE